MGKARTTALVAITLVALAAPAMADDPLELGLPVPDAGPILGPTAPHGEFAGGEVVLSPEDNHLNAYSPATGERFRVITSAHDGGGAGRDINGQVCFDPLHPDRFVAGEDTGQGLDGDGVAGWGYFELTTDDAGTPDPHGLLAGDVDGLGARQIGKLAPGYLGLPDNHGCGFLSDGTMVTATIGDNYPGEPANGELLLWFRDADGGFGQGYTTAGRPGAHEGVTNVPYGTVPYCKIAADLATAGGVWVGDDDSIYVAVNRPQGEPGGNPLGGEPGGIRRFSFSGGAPAAVRDADGVVTGVDGCSPSDPFTDQETGEEVTELRADPGVVSDEQFLQDLYVGPVNPLAVTPSGIVASDHGTFYVSSVFTGTITEFDVDGHLIRPILLPGEGLVADPSGLGITPFGMVVDGAGDLWVADLGIIGVVPGVGVGSVVRIPIGDDGLPGLPEAIDTGLTYPDGLGVTVVGLIG